MPRLRFSPLAESDIEQILLYSHVSFGEAARLRYEALIETGLQEIASDPHRVGVRIRQELGRGVRSYHLMYSRRAARLLRGVVRRPRHIIVFRLSEPDFIDIGRVLHDSMELKEHLPEGIFDIE